MSKGIARNFYLKGSTYDTNLLAYTNFHKYVQT